MHCHIALAGIARFVSIEKNPRMKEPQLDPPAASSAREPRRGRSTVTRIMLLMGLVVLLGAGWSWRQPIGHWWDAFLGNRPLLAAKSWHYQLMDISVAGLVRSDADVVVTEFSHSTGTRAAFTPDEVARIKARPGGGKRIALSYFSIGEAESYRFYWKPEWTEGNMPAWHVAENCAWPRNHLVRFWQDGWKDIIYRGPDSFLKRIVDAGFDGVYLDRIDVYEVLLSERPSAREDMIAFVSELAAAARRMKPGFLVVAQNAEDLLTEGRYRDVIDGLGKEDMLYGGHGTNERNGADDIAWSRERIAKLQSDLKPVFAVEYLSKPDLIAKTRRELLGADMVPTFAHRSLDGGDPVEPRPESTIKYGTPEWIGEQCQGKRHW